LITIALGNKPSSARAGAIGSTVAIRLRASMPTALLNFVLVFGGTRMLKDSPRPLDIYSTESDRQERAML
jgi:hypothetical protein